MKLILSSVLISSYPTFFPVLKFFLYQCITFIISNLFETFLAGTYFFFRLSPDFGDCWPHSISWWLVFRLMLQVLVRKLIYLKQHLGIQCQGHMWSMKFVRGFINLHRMVKLILEKLLSCTVWVYIVCLSVLGSLKANQGE